MKSTGDTRRSAWHDVKQTNEGSQVEVCLRERGDGGELKDAMEDEL